MAANSSVTSGHVTVGDDVTSSSEPLRDESVLANLDRYLWIYCSPWILCFGLLGNILIIIVVKSRNLHKSSTSIYLPMLAVFDCFTLLTGIITEWLDAMRIVTIKEISGLTCKLEKFLFYVSADTATWILVLFTVDRFVAVCFPLKKRAVCTTLCARLACVTFFVLSVGKNAHVFWTRGPETDASGNITSNCGRPEPYTHFELFIRPWIAFVYANLVPFIIIIICNVLIIRTLVRVQKMRKTQSNAEKSMTQTVLMCLSASFTFLVFITPSMALLIGKPYWTSDDETNYAYDIAKAVNNQLVMVNHSINIILYCASGHKFREDVMALVRCHCVCCDGQSDGAGSSSDGGDERNRARTNTGDKVKDADHAKGAETCRNNTAVTSLASSPAKSPSRDIKYTVVAKQNDSSSPTHNDVDIHIKDLTNNGIGKSNNVNPSDDCKKNDDMSHSETNHLNSPLSNITTSVSNQDKLTEKDSGIGIKYAMDGDAADNNTETLHGKQTQKSDYLSQCFEDELLSAGNHPDSSFTTSSEGSLHRAAVGGIDATHSQQYHSSPVSNPPSNNSDREKSVHSRTNSSVSRDDSTVADSTAGETGSDSESTVSAEGTIEIVDSIEDTEVRRILHLGNDVEESSDAVGADAVIPEMTSSAASGKLSPVLKVILMETTHF